MRVLVRLARRDVPAVVAQLGAAAHGRRAADAARQVDGGGRRRAALGAAPAEQRVDGGDDEQPERRPSPTRGCRAARSTACRPARRRSRSGRRAAGSRGRRPPPRRARRAPGARGRAGRPTRRRPCTGCPRPRIASRSASIVVVAVVADLRARDDLRAREPRGGAERVAVRVADLAGLQRGAGVGQLVAGADERDPRLAHDRRPRDVHRREHADLRAGE